MREFSARIINMNTEDLVTLLVRLLYGEGEGEGEEDKFHLSLY